MFNRIVTIFGRELASYYLSPIAYVLMALFTLLYGIFYSGIFVGFGVANLQYSYRDLLIVMLFLAPIMSMRVFAEERKNGVDELLMTLPISSTEIVVGKFVALVTAWLSLLGITLIHLGITLFFAKPDFGPIVGSIGGLILAGAAYLAICILMASFSDNQIIGALLGFTTLLIFWLLEWIGSSVGGQLGAVLEVLSINRYFNDFSKGIIDSINIVFYLTIIVAFIFLTIRQVESRRWR